MQKRSQRLYDGLWKEARRGLRGALAVRNYLGASVPEPETPTELRVLIEAGLAADPHGMLALRAIQIEEKGALRCANASHPTTMPLSLLFPGGCYC